MIIYDFHNFGIVPFCPDDNFVRFCAFDYKTIRLVKTACPLALAVTYEFVEISGHSFKDFKIFGIMNSLYSQIVACRPFFAHSPYCISLIHCAMFQILISKLNFQETSTVNQKSCFII